MADDDDMADLFSFTAGGGGSSSNKASTPKTTTSLTSSSSSTATPTTKTSSATPTTAATTRNAPSLERNDSTDSLDAMLESVDNEVPPSKTTTSKAAVTSSSSTNHKTSTRNTSSNKSKASSSNDDDDAKELLDWLEEEPDRTASTTTLTRQQQDHPNNKTGQLAALVPSYSSSSNKTPSADDDSTGAASANQPQSDADAQGGETTTRPERPQPTVVVLPPQFKSLPEALASPSATRRQIQDLYSQYMHQATSAAKSSKQQQQPLSSEQRQELYTRMICAKSLQDTAQCSLADSFEQWFQDKKDADSLSSMAWFQPQAQTLARKYAPPNHLDATALEQDLMQLLHYHYTCAAKASATASDQPQQQQSTESEQAASSEASSSSTTATTDTTAVVAAATTTTTAEELYQQQVLIPPVAVTLLATGMKLPVASVALQQIIPSYMPLLALQRMEEQDEQWQAALALHTELYLLACYHLPLLVYHLDRHLPGWYWPRIPQTTQQQQEKEGSKSKEGEASEEKADTSTDDAGSAKETKMEPTTPKEPAATEISRNLQKQGHVPPSWLLSSFAGEISLENDDKNKDGKTNKKGWLPPSPEWIWKVWDGLLTRENNATRFFLALALLEESADQLLLATESELEKELGHVLEMKGAMGTEMDSWMREWWSRADALAAATPDSVVHQLQQVEDQAVQQALQRRRKRAERALQAKLQAEAEAHRQAQELRADQARERLNRARLVAFYLKNAPEKEQNIDKIMEKYGAQLDVLEMKLRMKYGEGFNPALKPKPANNNNNNPANKLFAALGRAGRQKDASTDEEADDSMLNEPFLTPRVCFLVEPSEVLPVLCWSKEGSANLRAERRASATLPTNSASQPKAQRRYYLVDSRSDEAVAKQGRFPTALRVTPNDILDPEVMRQKEDMFESLRGAVHIVILGEGFSAIPTLYQQKLSEKFEQLMVEDESRTNNCALFFMKRGFPFVSVLEGGFAAAHAWLCREGPSHHLKTNMVLVDYDPEHSLFGQMETYHNASATGKVTRVMHGFLESSLVVMTKQAQQLEQFAAELDKNSSNNQEKTDGPAAAAAAGLHTRFGNMFRGGKKEGNVEVKADDLQLDSNEKKDQQKQDNPDKEEGDTSTTETSKTTTPASSSGGGGGGLPFKNPFAGLGGGGGGGQSGATSSADGKETGANGNKNNMPSFRMPKFGLGKNPEAATAEASSSGVAPQTDDKDKNSSNNNKAFKITIPNMLQRQQQQQPKEGEAGTNNADDSESGETSSWVGADAATTTQPKNNNNNSAPSMNPLGRFLQGAAKVAAASQENGNKKKTGAEGDDSTKETTPSAAQGPSTTGSGVPNPLKGFGAAQQMLAARNPFSNLNKQPSSNTSSSTSNAGSSSNATTAAPKSGGGGFSFRMPRMGGGRPAAATDDEFEISFNGEDQQKDGEEEMDLSTNEDMEDVPISATLGAIDQVDKSSPARPSTRKANVQKV